MQPLPTFPPKMQSTLPHCISQTVDGASNRCENLAAGAVYTIVKA
jgi:hypothetical protein